jgi:toxin CptA
MQQPDFIDLPLTASRYLALMLAISYGLAIVATLLLPLAWWWRLVGAVLILVSAALTIRSQVLLRGKRALVGLRLSRDGSCQLLLADGATLAGRLHRGWFVSPQLIVMRVGFPTKQRSRSITLLPDSAAADDLRRLRIFLRFAINLSGRAQ